MSKLKSMAQVVADVVEYYKTNPRGLSVDGCTYTGCSIGFVCGFTVDHWDEKINEDCCSRLPSFICVHKALGDKVWESFLPCYRIKNEDFWQEIQQFHDDDENWYKNDFGGSNLTVEGMKAFDDLMEYVRDLDNQSMEVEVEEDPHGPGSNGWDSGDEDQGTNK